MDLQELRTLKILEAIEDDEAASQRDLARQLNVSLGLVNAFVKRLVNKGYFKVRTIPRNRVRYILTPKGMAEKSRLTYEFIRYSFQIYKDARRRMKALFAQYASKGVHRVAFCGAGDLAEIAYLSLQETSLSLVAVFDDDKAGETFFGTGIHRLEAVNRFDVDRILLTAEKNTQRMLDRLREVSGGGATIDVLG